MSAAKKIYNPEYYNVDNSGDKITYSCVSNNVVYRFDYLAEEVNLEKCSNFLQPLSLPNNWWYDGTSMNSAEKIVPIESVKQKEITVENHPRSWSIKSGDYVREITEEDITLPIISKDKLYIKSFVMIYMFIASLILVVQSLYK